MSNESRHAHPDGETPYRHAGGDELTVHNSDARISDDQTVQLREEELQPRKQSAETGRVRVGKDIVEEQQTLEVPLTREEVTVERRPVNRQPADSAVGEGNDTIRVPVHKEQVSVDKRAVITAEINVGKRHVQETQQVSGTVRREEARIEHEGDVDLKQDR